MAASVPLRDYLRQRAAWVWNQQGHAFDHGLALQEETLTEMLLLRMARDHAKHGLTVTMFTKSEEAQNGADWEWIVRMPGCELGLRVQAKRLYHRDKKADYGGLDPNSGQAGKLIARAGSRIPVYVFFNHDAVSIPRFSRPEGSRLIEGEASGVAPSAAQRKCKLQRATSYPF